MLVVSCIVCSVNFRRAIYLVCIITLYNIFFFFFLLFSSLGLVLVLHLFFLVFFFFFFFNILGNLITTYTIQRKKNGLPFGIPRTTHDNREEELISRKHALAVILEDCRLFSVVVLF